MIRLKRAYEPAAKGDGRRVLVERSRLLNRLKQCGNHRR